LSSTNKSKKRLFKEKRKNDLHPNLEADPDPIIKKKKEIKDPTPNLKSKL